MTTVLISIAIVFCSLCAVALLKPEWLRRAVEFLIAITAGLAAWEWEAVLNTLKGVFE